MAERRQMTAMNQMWLEISGRVVAVTGANGGIGRATVRALLEQGARVAMLDRETLPSADLKALLADTTGECITIACDVADDAQVAAAAAEVSQRLGDCYGLVNNAALTMPGHLKDVSIADWSRQFDVNLTGYLRCAQAFAKPMLANGEGSIIHVASIAGSNVQGYSCGYSTTKAAILMLSRQLAFEWGPLGVRSNAISPGLIETPLTKAFYADAQLREQREKAVPLRRIGQPQDIADVAAFLLSGRSAYVNGAEITVDGGFTQTLMSHIPRPGRS